MYIERKVGCVDFNVTFAYLRLSTDAAVSYKVIERSIVYTSHVNPKTIEKHRSKNIFGGMNNLAIFLCSHEGRVCTPLLQHNDQ